MKKYIYVNYVEQRMVVGTAQEIADTVNKWETIQPPAEFGDYDFVEVDRPNTQIQFSDVFTSKVFPHPDCDNY